MSAVCRVSTQEVANERRDRRQRRRPTRRDPRREWSNVVERRQQGTHKVSEWTLQKRKTRWLAQERDISRGRASHLLKHEGVAVPDEVVL